MNLQTFSPEKERWVEENTSVKYWHKLSNEHVYESCSCASDQARCFKGIFSLVQFKLNQQHLWPNVTGFTTQIIWPITWPSTSPPKKVVMRSLTIHSPVFFFSMDFRSHQTVFYLFIFFIALDLPKSHPLHYLKTFLTVRREGW